MTKRVRRLEPQVAGSKIAGVSLALQLSLSFLVVISAPAPAQDSGNGAAPKARTDDRVSRLQDALDVEREWDIGVPPVETEPTFEDHISAGTALDSEAYLALDAELRRTQQALAENPDDPQARRQLQEIRTALTTRIEANMSLGYRYATRVYIAMLEDAGAPPEQIRNYRQSLEEMPRP